MPIHCIRLLCRFIASCIKQPSGPKHKVVIPTPSAALRVDSAERRGGTCVAVIYLHSARFGFTPQLDSATNNFRRSYSFGRIPGVDDQLCVPHDPWIVVV